MTEGDIIQKSVSATKDSTVSAYKRICKPDTIPMLGSKHKTLPPYLRDKAACTRASLCRAVGG